MKPMAVCASASMQQIQWKMSTMWWKCCHELSNGFANCHLFISEPDMAYAPKLIDYFENPRCAGEIENADAVAQVSNPVCGDVMKLWLKIDSGAITDAKFKAQ